MEVSVDAVITAVNTIRLRVTGVADIEKLRALDTVMFGASKFATVITAVFALAISEALIVTANGFGDIKVVDLGLPCYCTDGNAEKLFPEATSVNPAPPASTTLGLSEVNTGAIPAASVTM